MTSRAKLRSVIAPAFVAFIAMSPTIAQTQAPNTPAKKWIPARTPDGHPDLQGIWSNATITPLERPVELAGKAVLTEQEAAAYEKQIRERNNVDRRLEVGTETDVALAYNDAWYDRGTKTVKTLRTSLIVDPPDGRIPALTPEAQKKARDRAEAPGCIPPMVPRIVL